ncbi:MAG: hypothetical protein JWN75_1035 [Candidatus Saccharibacteria bacterium]|nr:hypothetical protein [Candidatus Saccharibacteria bacterium]
MAENEKIITKSHEQASDVEQFGELAHERHEAMRDQLERAERQHKADKSEQEAFREATEIAEKMESKNESHSAISPAERRRPAPSKKQREASLKSQLKQVQGEMSTSSRLFSKFIHNKAIENMSDGASSTIARPNALLSGSIAAFIGVTVSYFVAKYYGYQLSGFETIAAFVFGWIIGILYDYFSVMLRGHRKD